mgnify:CR=1 FL=1
MRYNVHYTDEENAVRLMDMEQVKDLLARRAYYLDSGDYTGELSDLWVAEPEHQSTASYGENWGYYVGMDSLKEKYAGGFQKREAARLAAYGKSAGDIGLGYGAVHTVNTGHVVLSYDGETARGLFYDVYERSLGRPDGTAETIVVCGPLACDFIREAGGWKIWNLFQGADHVFTVGETYANVPIPRPDDQNPVALDFQDPDVALKTYDPDYGWADNYPPMPDPYFTFRPEEGYGPEGHPDYCKEVDLT